PPWRSVCAPGAMAFSFSRRPDSERRSSMSFFPWLRNRTFARTSRVCAQHQRAGRRFRPAFEVLEDRTVPSGVLSTLKGTSLADSRNGTLREAILTADKHLNKAYEIDIVVPGTILLKSSLPDLANTITIKGLGTSQTLIQRDLLAASCRILTVDA